MTQDFYVLFGHHKAATNWFSKIMLSSAKVLGLPGARFNNWVLFEPEARRQGLGYYRDFVDNARLTGARVLAVTDADPRFVGMTPIHTGFHVVRDPRDTIVSAYFSHLKTHGLDYLPSMEEHRARLQTLSKDDGLIDVMDYVAPLMQDLRAWPGHPSVVEVKMETATQNPMGFFTHMFGKMGWMAPARPGREPGLEPHDLRRVLDEHSFEKLAGGRARGQEDASSHYRKGTPGDWTHHFTARHVAAFKERYNDVLIKWGYEASPDWTCTPR